MFTTALFDFDGTIIDSLEMWVDVDKEFFARRGFEYDPEYGKEIASMTLEEAALYTVGEYELLENPHAVVAEWLALAKRQYASVLQPKPGVIPYLYKLKGEGKKLAMVTASDPDLFKPAVERLGLSYIFDAFIYSGNFGAKDTPEFFTYCCKLLEKDPVECMAYDDSLSNLKAAKEAGLKITGVYDSHWDEDQEEIISISDMYIKDFTALI